MSQVVILLLLLLMLGIGTLPGYLSGHWTWQEPPRLINLQKLKQIRQNGLTLPGWQTVEQREEAIGGHKWSYQIIQKQVPKTEAIVLLLPQNGPRDQPQAEWMEINSWGRWNVAQERLVEFSVNALKPNTETLIKAEFFRASTKQQTFAVLQWYAWSSGGNPSPLPWFLADQLAQWQQKRTAWVAVSILIPMESFGQVETTWQEAQSLGKTVHAALEADFL